MIASEPSSRTPRTATGAFAMLRLLGRHGGRAPSNPRTRLVLGALLAGLFAIALFAAAAQARQTRILTETLGGASSHVANPYPVTHPWSVAVDTSAGPSGDVYVSDGESNRVEKFDSSGNFLLMFGKEVNKGKVEAGGKTEAEENLCLAGEECQAGTAGTTPGAFGGGSDGEAGIIYLAVDETSGDVYVGDNSDGIVTKFDPSGQLISSWGTAGQLAGVGAETFNQIIGLAVDPIGDLWVEAERGIDGPKAFEFRKESTFTGNSWPVILITAGGNAQVGIRGFAADGEGHIYLEAGNETWKLSASGEKIGLVTGPGIRTEGITVDPDTGELYVDADLGAGVSAIDRYDATCQPVPDFSFHGCTPAETFSPADFAAGGPQALAFNPADAAQPLVVDMYSRSEVAVFSIETVPDVTTLKASGFTGTAATLGGTVNPSGEPLTECFFEWGETESYGELAECEPNAASIGAGESPVSVHAQIPVRPGHSYQFRLAAANANDVNSVVDEPERGQDLSFGPPRIDSTWADEVAATGATLEAEIDPENVAARYHFEYLTEAAYLADGESFAGPEPAAVIPVPDAALGSGGADVGVSQRPQGLQPDTTYLYRAVAGSPLGEGPEAVSGPIRAFTTQAPGPFMLPDARAWEMVSPPDKHGALIEPLSGVNALAVTIQAAGDGSALTYDTNAPTESSPAGYAGYVQVLSTRGAAGWASRDLAIPHAASIGRSAGQEEEYPYFSSDLSLAALQPFGAFDPSLSPQATEQTPYLRTNAPPGGPCAGSCYLPLVSAADTPPATKFGEEGKCPPQIVCGPRFLGATPDLQHVVLSSVAGLTATPGDKGGLYEWSAGSLSLISQAPAGAGTLCGGASPACVPGLGALGVQSGGGQLISRHAISADGSLVFWTSTNTHLYLRDLTSGESLQLDAVQGGPGSGKAAPQFQDASADGSRVFFTDEEALTAGSGAAENHPDLYECQIETGPAGLHCALTDLTPETGGLGADVVPGFIPGVSADGSYVYFVADGALAPGGVSGSCDATGATASPAALCNLYLYHAGVTRLVAVLSGADRPDWGGGSTGGLYVMTDRVSPDGRFLAFMSQRQLTGYDNRDAASGNPDQEVYLYHASAAGAGTLTCASCDPTGARPHGLEVGRNGNGALPNMPLASTGPWQGTQSLAANVPPWTPFSGSSAIYQSRYLSDSGRLFFNARDALVPKDVNATGDIYQYEPEAVGTCAASTLSGSEVFEPAATAEVEGREVQRGSGCVGLVSSGEGSEESAFLDASEAGDDVFFLTAAQLSPRDSDHALDVYDARVGGGLAEPAPPIPCIGDACQQPAVPPDHPTPGTLTLNGPGNLTECPKGKKLQKGKCVKQKSKKKNQKKGKHKKSSKRKGNKQNNKRANSKHGGHK